ncbi:MAG TPA: hypothetical protein PLP61_02950 [Nocardioides sp.]|uniref:hypothetical protein n=1 Tax=Nocardioides sp. TaxID=35761 RepID=UPI002C90C7DF|nr:hypothetical protein [Nocardioides sp.]HQR25975.1 hypothetical protein [Nocardioides sp.]
MSVVAWLPFLHRPLTPDESGFLLLGQHWAPGTSLYGDYWVDRPPLLIWLFSWAGGLGPTTVSSVGLTAPTVKLLGATASGVAVVLSGVLAVQVAPQARWARRAAVVVAVALLSDPLLGMPETDGEVLAVPLVLLGLACLAGAMRTSRRRHAVLLTTIAGIAAMAAGLVKQNVIDVFVFALVLFVVSIGRVPDLRRRVAAFTLGSAAMLGAALTASWLRGTSPAALWDAIVVFRAQAAHVISASASAATPQRMSHLVLASFGSGAALLLIATAGHVLLRVVRDRGHAAGSTAHQPGRGGLVLVWPTLAMVVWEVAAVALGGSYWLHYLTGLVPGLVVLVALTRPHGWWRVALTALVAYLAAASLVVWAHEAVAPSSVSSEASVAAYLRGHARGGDGVVVTFGHPDIVAASGLHSPYEHLWSLPVRVRDPRLEELQQVLAGPAAPRWVVVSGESIDSWGLDARQAQHYLERHYVEQVSYGDWHVWQRQEGGDG